MLAVRRAEFPGTGWAIYLPSIQYAMNTQRHSAINTSPYEVVFGQQACAGVFPGCSNMQIDEQDVLKVLQVDDLDGPVEKECENDNEEFEFDVNEDVFDNVNMVFESNAADIHDSPAENKDDSEEFDPTGDRLDDVNKVESGEDGHAHEPATSECVSEDVKPDDNDRDRRLGTSARHVKRRKRALVHYEQAAQNQIKKQTRNKRVRLQAHVVGDYVTVRVPHQDRTSSDLPRLPAIIVEVQGTKRFSYRLRSLHGIIDRLYDENNLEKFSGRIEGLDENNWENDNKISLREAARLARAGNGGPVTGYCKCRKGCRLSKNCSCVQSGAECHSKCHYGLHCKNQSSQSTCTGTEHAITEQAKKTTVCSTTNPGDTPIVATSSLLTTQPTTSTTSSSTKTTQSNSCTSLSITAQSTQQNASFVAVTKSTTAQPKLVSFFNTRTHKTTSFVSSTSRSSIPSFLRTTNKLSVPTQASISSFFKKSIQPSGITHSKESITTTLPSTLTVSLMSAASSQVSTTVTSPIMTTPTSTCQTTTLTGIFQMTATSTCQTTTPTNTCQTTTPSSTFQTMSPTNTFQTSPPSISSLGHVSKCGCGNSCTVLKKCSCRQKGQLCSKKCHHGRRCSNSMKVKSSMTITMDSDDEDTVKVNQFRNMWLPHLHLSKIDERCLLGSGWLNDSHILAAETLLKKQFPTVDGLLSPLIGASETGFAPVEEGAIQIHNNGHLHWLTSTLGILSPNCIDIFDSLSGGSLSLHLRRQLSDLYRLIADEDGKIQVTIKPVQQQRLGKGNCGLFSIAFATSLCHGIDPTTTTFCEHSLRKHLHKCLQLGAITPFPKSSLSVARAAETKVKISIHCTCYMHLPGSKMIQCNSCDSWYHVKCVSEQKNRAKIVQQATWHCSSCVNTSN
jgi:polycystin 1L2